MTVVTLTPDAIDAWAAAEAQPPYAYYGDFTAAARTRYRAEQLRRTLASPHHHALAVSDDAGRAALAGVTTLAWDSEQFGFSAGRLDYLLLRDAAGAPLREPAAACALARRALQAALAHADALGVRHLSARFDSRDLPLVQACEAERFELVDAILKFALRDDAWGGAPPLPAGVALRDAREADIPALADLAARGFLYDRFHNDPALPAGVADRVHAAWLTNAVKGRTGDGVLVAEVDGRPAGFFILALDRAAGEHFGCPVGTLVLITVDAALRRRGVAVALSQGSVAWLPERGARRFEVGTQLANVPAANVYLKSGFRLVNTSLSLRRMTP